MHAIQRTPSLPEITRLDRIRAIQVLAGDTHEPVDYQFAARLVFARFLAQTGRLSEWTVKP